MRILVTGARGFLGSHLVPYLTDQGHEVSTPTSSQFDLTNLEATKECLVEAKPEVIYHLAGLSGGIGANLEAPARYYFVNSLIITNMFEAASKIDCKHLIVPMGGCSYPSTAVSPIGEDQMWMGYPHGASSAYSSAKKMAIVAGEAYRKEGLSSTVVVPGNMYGEYDNYSLKDSHVIPALIRKLFEAKQNDSSSISMWGSGTPLRDFVYAGDVAYVLSAILGRKELHGPINISSGTSISIRGVTELAAKLLDYQGKIEWDSSKPDGQMVKIFDVTLLKEMGYSCSTELEEGLRKTIKWFQQNYFELGRVRL